MNPLFNSIHETVSMFAIFVSCFLFFNSVVVYLLIMPFSWAKGGGGPAKTEIHSRWRKIWTRWIPIPTGVGITLLAILQWRNIRNKKIQEEQQQKTFRDWEITCYRSVPLRPLSRAWGWLSDRPVPVSLRSWVYGNYSRLYAVNLEEIEHDLLSYPSLAEFFSRRLKDGVRPIDQANCIVSPADGKILNVGEVKSCHIEQVKGVTYTIQTFLGDMSWKQDSCTQLECVNNIIDKKENNNNDIYDKDNINAYKNNSYNFINNASIRSDIVNAQSAVTSFGFSQLSNKRFDHTAVTWNQYKRLLLKNPEENELYQLVVYLAPGDYHRFHSPVHWRVHYRRHFQGELLSVNPKIASWVPELFSLNERVIYFGEWEYGFFSMAAVGATNVGSIRVHSDETLHTNCRKWRNGIRHRDRLCDLFWQKGEEIGEFRMGSTVVVLFEAPRGCKFNIEPSQKVLVGQSVTCVIEKGICDKEND